MKIRLVGAGMILALSALPASAVVTATWDVETYPQFDAGDASSAFITSLGEVRPGWDTKRTALDGDGVWSALRLADGAILIGSDDAGAILKVTDGGAKKLGAIDGAIAVVALAQGDGAVYAGAMPGGKLWKVDPANGKSTAVATLPGVETIWSLAVGGDGTVYAGTGPDGKLFAVKGGTAKVLYDTEDKRVTAIAIDKGGAVWFGTSERALVFRYDPKASGDKVRAMADFAGNEIGAIAALGGGVVVAANDLTDAGGAGAKTAAQVEAAEKPAAPKGQAPKTPDVGSKPGADKDTPAAVDTGRKGARKGKGALFRVGDDGRLEQLHALTQTYFTSIAVAADGSIYAGAADKGRVYLIEPDDTVATAFDVDERAVSQVFWDKSNLAFTTDDAAALYRATGRASAAKYVSDVLDAKAVARFGRLVWQASGKLRVETRSGNTAKPGTGWSGWQAPAGVTKLGGGGDSGKIQSPPGRYFQFRVSFEESDAKLRRVSTYYVPQNTATAIEEVSFEPVQKETAPTLKDSASKPRSPVLRVKWKIDNADNDDTTYTIEARREGEANWREVSTGKTPLTATQWEWNTETFPDGWYRVRVTSSDRMANSPDRALTASKTTPLYAIDNTRPTIDGLSVAYPKATARASDAIGVITEMAFSVDDEAWQLGATADGIFDDLVEELRIDLPAGLAKGSHTLAVRAADAAGNVATVSTTFVVK